MPFLIKGGSENVPTNIFVMAIREQIELARRYKMSYAEIVGVLEMCKQEILDEAREMSE